MKEDLNNYDVYLNLRKEVKAPNTEVAAREFLDDLKNSPYKYVRPLMMVTELGSPAPEDLWAIASDDVCEVWEGPFSSREEAIAEGKAMYEGDSFVISKAEHTKIEVPSRDAIEDLILDSLSEDTPEVGYDDVVRTLRTYGEDLHHRITKSFEEWFKENNIKFRSFVVKMKELEFVDEDSQECT